MVDPPTYVAVVWAVHHQPHKGANTMHLLRRVRRFIHALSPQRTDVWDWRTYGSPFASLNHARDWFAAVGMVWEDTK